MLEKVSLNTRSIEGYRFIVGSEALDGLYDLARELRGVRVCHVNSTPFGGGVAELLTSYIPLARSLGIEMDWQVIHGDLRFFTLTKCLHNALQGGECSFIKRKSSQNLYRTTNQANAGELDKDYDVFIINDPQPAALRHYVEDGNAKWVWRCHVDSSEPDPEAWGFLKPYVEEHDAAVFTHPDFALPGLEVRQAIMAPAIDALGTKNMALQREMWREVLEVMGIDRTRPLMTQVARFDPWKDPHGVIEVFQNARERVPGLQLAFVGSLASDDPEGWEIYGQIHRIASQDPDIHVFSNLTGAGNLEVNAFQTASDVIIQKSIKEGFGLVVSEALWKGTPVVAGKVGGIRLQMIGPLEEYLIDDIQGAADRVVYLLENPAEAAEVGRLGRERVRANFLMPSLLRNELTLIKEILAE